MSDQSCPKRQKKRCYLTNLQSRLALKQLHAYVPGQSIESVTREYGIINPIKLASNENPLGCPLSAKDLELAIRKSHYYPDQHVHPLRDQLASHFQILPKQVLLGNGSDDILEMIGLAWLNEGDEVLTSEHTFSVYSHVAHVMGCSLNRVPLKNYAYDLEGLAKSVTEKTKAIFISNPNNPTGTFSEVDEVKAFLDKIPSSIIVVLDEAYIEYSQKTSAVTLISNYENLIVLRTFSKLYGLAGFRIGYAIAQETTIQELEKVRQPFNVSTLSLEAAAQVLKKPQWIEKTLSINNKGKAYFNEALKNLPITIIPTEANFICILMNKDAKNISDKLIKNGIIIRPLTSFGLPNAIRVSIGLEEQNYAFVSAFKECLSE